MSTIWVDTQGSITKGLMRGTRSRLEGVELKAMVKNVLYLFVTLLSAADSDLYSLR